jgi:type VI secretion system protein ImpG
MEELLPYYNRELGYLRKLGAEFAEKHPKIAARLRLSKDMAEDPHISRLVESFSFLTARIRRKIDDSFPEITKSMLGTLYPHYLAPFPSCSIARFQPDQALAETAVPSLIERHSAVETDSIDGQPCRFRTCYPVSVWPIRIADAGLHGPPFPAPKTRLSRNAAGVIRIQLETLSPKLRFADLPLDRLRFFLYGQSAHLQELYERLLNNATGVALAAPNGEAFQLLDSTALSPVGFAADEGLIDYSARSFLGYRLLSEYFAFPDKFLFIDLTGISPTQLLQSECGNRLEVFIFLNESSVDLERNVDKSTFQLGCTPIVNLFEHRAEPIRLTQNVYEYRVAADARRPQAFEIFSIDRVIGSSPADEEVEFLPLYSVQHGGVGGPRPAFWHASRRPSTVATAAVDHGSEVYLSLADLGASPVDFHEWVADVQATCLNRDLPGRLPFGGGQPHLHLVSGKAAARVECLTPPTRTLRPPLGDALLWRLVSLLSLNHLSLVDGVDQGAALREVLGLHDLAASRQTRAAVDAISSVSSRRIVGRAGGAAAGGFCRGVEVTVGLDEERFSGGGMYLFAAVLERFLGLYANINSFTKLRVTTNKREGVFCQWPPRAAEQVLA